MANSEFELGNVAIEDAIISEPECRYGVGRAHLEMAIGHFGQARSQLAVFINLCRETISLLERGDYEPFLPASSLDPINEFKT